MNTVTQQQQLKLKTASVKKATRKAFEMMPDQFSSLTLCLTARKVLNNMTMDGTILRRLRELRKEGTCVYKVIDPINSIYEKVKTDEG